MTAGRGAQAAPVVLASQQGIAPRLRRGAGSREATMAREGFIDVPGARLWFWDAEGDGAPVLLCHPASQGAEIWTHQMQALASAGLRPLAYARRGHAPTVTTDARQTGTQVGDLLAVLDALGIAQVHLVGAAAGGGVAMRFVAAHGARVRSLVLAGSIVSPSEPDWREIYARLGIAAVKAHVPVEFIELGPSYRASNPAGTKRFAELSAQALATGSVAQPAGFDLTWADMERTTCPVLLVAGEADLYAPPPLMRLLAGHLPGHAFVTLPEIGHAPFWEAPDAFNRLLIDFLSGQPASRGG